MQAKTDRILILSFALFLLFFGATTWMMSPDRISSDENRALSQCPKLRLKTVSGFPSAFESFVNDRMPLRTAFVKARNWLKYVIFGVSSSPDILAGKSGWLYLLSEGGANQLPLFRHENPFNQHELFEWRRSLTECTRWLGKRGIRYVFVVAPDKSTVYPEFLPGTFHLVNPQSRLDQLSAYLKGDKEIVFVNPTEALKSKKRQGELYYRTDSHWNQLGAFVAYREIMQAMNAWFPALKAFDLESARISGPHSTGDCAKMLGISGMLADHDVQVKLRNCAGEPPGLWLADNPFGVSIFQGKNRRLPRALILHDSFSWALKPYLAHHFSYMYCIYQGDLFISPDLIAAQKPDVIIQEVVERRAMQFSPGFMQDWRNWAVQVVKQNGPENVYINVMPNTPNVNAAMFQAKCAALKLMIKPTTARAWSRPGDCVPFDQKTALYCDWYLLKTGNQGRQFNDRASEEHYRQLENFVMNGKHYRRTADFALPDGSTLNLYKKTG